MFVISRFIPAIFPLIGVSFSLAADLAPSIMSQPVSQIVKLGSAATYTVVASGTAPLSYQWYDKGVRIPGATSASYTTPPTVNSDSGSYFRVRVANGVGAAISANADLTVAVAPGIASQPVSQTVKLGAVATFTVVASGTAPLSYQWYDKGVRIPGATSASYTTHATVGSDSGSYFRVKVSNIGGEQTSMNAGLTVAVAPSITSQPASQIVKLGSAATFTVVASGTAPLSYQWFDKGARIPGATSASYTTSATVGSDSGSYFRVRVANVGGEETSVNAGLTVAVAPSITIQPVRQTVKLGSAATYTVVAGGTAPFTYQWYNKGVRIPGAYSASYTTPATVDSDSGSYFRVKVSNVGGEETSVNAGLTVALAPSITSQPVGQTVSHGAIATFKVMASGTAPLSYRWYKNGVSLPGAIAASYTTLPTVTGDSGAYCVKVANVVGEETSSEAILTVGPAAQLIQFGGRVPRTDFYAANVAAFSGPFKGTVVTSMGGDLLFRHNAGAVGGFLDDRTALSSAPAGILARNYVRVLCSAEISEYGEKWDWFDDSDWAAAETNLHNLVLNAKSGGMGILIDTEPYAIYGFNPWMFGDQPASMTVGNPDGHTFKEMQSKVRERGLRFIQIIQSDAPGSEILFTTLLSSMRNLLYEGDGSVKSSIDAADLQGSRYGLLASFLDGILDGIEPGMKLIDGNEGSYYYSYESEFADGRINVMNDSLVLIENDLKYKEYVRVGMAVYLNGIMNYEASSKPFYNSYYFSSNPETAALERYRYLVYNVFQSLQYSNGTAWLWSDSSGTELDWWTPSTVPVEISKAIRDAVSLYNQGLPDGYFDDIPGIMSAAEGRKIRITGTVTDDAGPLSGVKMKALSSPDSSVDSIYCTDTDLNGNYICYIKSGWSGILRPELTGAAPSSRSYISQSTNVGNQDFHQ